VHHSGVENGTIQGYADYHVNTRKWYHIGYHMVVKGSQLYQTNDLLTFSYHTSGNNNYTVGISVSGDFTKRSMTDDERNNLYAGILTLMEMFNIPVEHVLGHNQYPGNEKTECPGFSMDVVRDDIRKLQLQLKAVADPSQIKVNAYKATEQHRYLYNQYIADPVANKWLEPYLLKMDEVTRDMGMYFNK
jgi:hypothetical protein